MDTTPVNPNSQNAGNAKTDPERRTGPSTGNTRGNDLPSDAKTTHDTRTIEGAGEESVPGRDAPGSEVTGSSGRTTPEMPEE